MSTGDGEVVPAVASIWDRAANALESRQANGCEHSLWDVAEACLHVGNYRPRRADDFELAEVGGALPYVLHSPSAMSYIRIGEHDLFFWNLMNGERTVKDLLMAYVDEYGTLGNAVLIDLLGKLKTAGLLNDRPRSLAAGLAGRFEHRPLVAHAARFISAFNHTVVATRRADSIFHRLDRAGGRYMSRALELSALVVVPAALAGGAWFHFIERKSLVLQDDVVGPVSSFDIGLTYLVLYAGILLHEVAHGLAVKRFGRRVNRAGVVVNTGYPAPFVDVTDMWMTGRGPRVAVSLAGPLLNALLASLLFAVGFALEEGVIREMFFVTGAMHSLLFVMNLLPVGDSDGYYIVQDLTGRTALRLDAWRFVRHGVWRKIAGRERWSRGDLLLGTYGVASLAGTGAIAFFGLHLWETTLVHIVRDIVERPMLAAETVAVLSVLGVVAAAVSHRRSHAHQHKRSMHEILAERVHP